MSTAVLLQCHVDGGQRVHGPAGVLVTGGKQSLHERPYKLREAALHNALPHRAHQGELVGDVVDGDVMHGCRVTLKQSMKVSPTMSETEDRLIIHIVIQNTCGPKRLNNEALITLA